ncbi:MAG: Holliday junction branch migration protein RuvA [Methylococcaceae bacterium]|nr:MAG: Holliday junction branch migration protein RuvA [Methylococcaceae bacterium]
MIGFLRGKLIAKKVPFLLLDVGGVGYEVEAPMTTFYQLPALGETVTLYTHLAIREDAHNLFGFFAEAERSLFRSLIKVNGVGAKLALTILSGLSAEEFHRAIECNDLSALVRLPGIGKKTAERLVIEMRDRLPGIEGDVSLVSKAESTTAVASPVQDAVSALIALGFKAPDASRMVRDIPAEGKSSEDLIRLALRAAAKTM